MRQTLENVTFAPGAAGSGKITLNDFTTVDLKRLIVVVNCTTGVIIYNATDQSKNATVTGNAFVFGIDTSGMLAGDSISVTYDVGVNDTDYQDPTIVATELNTFRDDFDFDPNSVGYNDTKWAPVPGQTTSAGLAASISGGKMIITSGVVANAKAGFRSRLPFRLPFRLQFTSQLSQRIVNQSFVIQITNAAGDTVAQFLYDGTLATNVKVASTKKGSASIAATLVTCNTSATMNILEIDARIDGIDFADRLPDTSSASIVRATRTRTTLINTEDYFIEFYVLNGATAPASTTTWTIEKVVNQPVAKEVVEVSAGRGNASPARSVPVVHTGAIALGAAPASNARTGFIAKSGIWYQDSITVLAAAATFTGTTRDVMATATAVTLAVATAYPEEFSVEASADVAGTLYIEVSNDGTIWHRIKSKALAQADATSRFYGEIIHDPKTRYARAVFVNGAAAQTIFSLTTNQMAA